MQRVVVIVIAAHSCRRRIAPADVLGRDTSCADVASSICGLCASIGNRTCDQTILLQLVYIDITATGSIGNRKHNIFADTHIVEIDDGVSGTADWACAIWHFATCENIIPIDFISPRCSCIVIEEVGGIYVIQRGLGSQCCICINWIFHAINHANNLVGTLSVITATAIG